jgi:hypothetical protein
MYDCPVCRNAYEQHHVIPASIDRRAKPRGSDRRDGWRRLLDRLGLRRTGAHVPRHPEQDGPK